MARGGRGLFIYKLIKIFNNPESIWNWFGLISRKQLITWPNKKYYLHEGLLKNSMKFNVKVRRAYFLSLYGFNTPYYLFTRVVPYVTGPRFNSYHGMFFFPFFKNFIYFKTVFMNYTLMYSKDNKMSNFLLYEQFLP